MPQREPGLGMLHNSREIDGKGRTVRELLSGRKYSIDYYQREYKWQQKQVADLLDDLADEIGDPPMYRKAGYLFLTGDENPYPAVSRHHIEALVGEKLDEDIPLAEVIAAAAETYHIFFLIPDLARRKRCEARWRNLLGNHTICMESPADTCAVAAAIVGLTEKLIPDLDALAGILSSNGVNHQHIGSTVRALQDYAALLKLPPAIQGEIREGRVSFGHAKVILALTSEAQQKLAELKRAQDDLERERAALEELRRRQTEFQTGRQEMIHHLTRGLGLLEEAELTARRETEQMALTLSEFRQAVSKVQTINEQLWSQDNFSVELTRALTTLENARMEWNAARLRFPILSAAAPAGAPAAASEAAPSLLATASLGQLCRIGFALTWPLALVGVAIFVLLLAVLHR